MRAPPALAVGLVGLAVTVALLVLLDIAPGDGWLLMGISAGGALAVGLAGVGLLRLLPNARFVVQMVIVVVTGVAAVAAGALAATTKMLLPTADVHRFVIVVAAAGTVGALVSLLLSRRVTLAQGLVAEAARRLADDEPAPVGPPPPIREFAVLAADLEATRRRLDESRRRERQLDAARRELIAWLSHDLRTPLAGIRALTEALEDGVVTDPETVARYHRRLGCEAERVADMVEDLFALSRIHAGVAPSSRPLLALGDLVSEAVASIEAVAARAGVVVDACRDADVDVRADPSEIARVLDNLLVNAVRETPAGGRVQVRLWADAEAGVVTVADGCGGIPADVLPRVFEAGYRATSARTPGRDARGGFGLTIARGLAEAHGGTLDVENADAGCVFRLRLPRDTATPSPRVASEYAADRAEDPLREQRRGAPGLPGRR